MTFTSAQPDDSATIPISSDYSPQNNAFYALPGAPGGYLDAFGNTSSPAVMSFAVPLITQKNSGITGAASTSLVIPFFYPNIAGNSIVVSLGLGVTLGPNIVLSVTDSVGNIYQQAGLAAQGNGLTAAIFYATKIGLDIGTPNVVTVSISGSGALAGTSIAATIYEIPGLIFASNALDQVATGSSASSSQASTSAVSPVSPNQLAVMAVATGGTQTVGQFSLWGVRPSKRSQASLNYSQQLRRLPRKPLSFRLLHGVRHLRHSGQLFYQWKEHSRLVVSKQIFLNRIRYLCPTQHHKVLSPLWCLRVASLQARTPF
jgi:hypothetical protein